jgi:hypothetical protein
LRTGARVGALTSFSFDLAQDTPLLDRKPSHEDHRDPESPTRLEPLSKNPARRAELCALLRPLDRRTLLKSSLAAAAAVSLTPVLPGCRSAPPDGERFAKLRFLDPEEGYVLERFASRLLPAHPPRPTVEEIELVLRLDREIGWLAENVGADLGRNLERLVRLAEYGPFFIGFHFSRFSRLAPAAQDEYLAAWERHRLASLQMAFRSLRALCVFFFLCDERTWDSLRYAGPWITGGEAKLASWRRDGA